VPPSVAEAFKQEHLKVIFGGRYLPAKTPEILSVQVTGLNFKAI
jgi:hypothetical protein